jgi:hypothetical protein
VIYRLLYDLLVELADCNEQYTEISCLKHVLILVVDFLMLIEGHIAF